MKLITSKWESKNPNKRKQWIENSNPSNSKHLKIIIYLSKNDEDDDIREATVEKLNDSKILADIARNDQNDAVREAAMRKLSENYPKILAKIAKNDENDNLREAAVENLTSSKILADIARNDQNDTIREAAMRQLSNSNPKVLADIALNDKNKEIRKQARQFFQSIECPKCSSFTQIVGSLFSTSGHGYGCIKCNWRRRKCANPECNGYLEYNTDYLSLYPGHVEYFCEMCGWGGAGVAFHDKNK